MLAVLLGGAPLDGWLHGYDHAAPLDGTCQVHDGGCQHLADSPHDPACQVCTTARALGAPPQHAVAHASTLAARLSPPPAHRSPTRLALVGSLGARGPPVAG